MILPIVNTPYPTFFDPILYEQVGTIISQTEFDDC